AEPAHAPAGRLLERTELLVHRPRGLEPLRSAERVEPRVPERDDRLVDPRLRHVLELRVDRPELPPERPSARPARLRLLGEDHEPLLPGRTYHTRQLPPRAQQLDVGGRVEVRVDVDDRHGTGADSSA